MSGVGGGGRGGSKGVEHFDELDIALGLGSLGSNGGDGPVSAGSKAIDPFLNAGSIMANGGRTSRLGGFGHQKK